MKAARIVIVGGGFSGTVLAARLLDTLSVPATVTIIEASGTIGPGLAYSTSHPSHLMNTPARAISAVPGQPLHFEEWRSRQPSGECDGAATFVRRATYGRYLRDLIDAAAHRSDIGLSHLFGEVIDLSHTAGAFLLRLASGREIEADFVALCTGYGLASGGAPLRRVVDDPWSEGWSARVATDDPIIFKGSGLTMVDQVLRLRSEGHRGPLLAISRHGLVPQTHLGSPSPPAPVLAPTAVTRLSRLLRDVRNEVKRHPDWRPPFDGIRPLNGIIWGAFDVRQRARFDRHLRAYWNVHRHRMAPDVGKSISDLRSAGTLEVRAGRIEEVLDSAGGVRVGVRWRGRPGIETRSAAWLIDCSRPTRAGATPLEWSLLAHGFAHQRDGIVLDVGADGAVRDRHGGRIRGLYALGPPARTALGEITAIPEIRDIGAAVASSIALSLSQDGIAARTEAATVPLLRNPRLR